MKKSLALFAAITACGLLPSGAQAVCNAGGTIPRVFVQAGVTNIGVRANGPGTIFVNFTTNNLAFITAALTAEASHMTVQVAGNAAACSAPAGGLSNGGAVTAILVSP